MARSATLDALKERILWRADLPSNTTRINTTNGGELETWIQEAAAELWEIVTQAWGEDYAFGEASLATVSGTRYVSLPAAHYKTIALWWTPTGYSTPTRLDVFPEDEEFARAGTPYWSATTVPRYRERGDRIYFEPTPDAIYSLTLQYVPVMTAIDSGSNPFPGVHGWEQWIEVRCAINCLQKDQADATHLERELSRQTDRIRTMAPRRNIHRTQHVRRTRESRWRNRSAAVRYR